MSVFRLVRLGLSAIAVSTVFMACSPSPEPVPAIVPETNATPSQAQQPKASASLSTDELKKSGWLETVSQRIKDGQYQLRPTDDGLSFISPEHALRVRVTHDGAHLSAPQAKADSPAPIRVRTDAISVDGRSLMVSAVAPKAGACAIPERIDEMGRCVQRIERRFEGVTEWWQNAPRTLAQGWTFDRTLQGAERLAVQLEFPGAQALESRGERNLVIRAAQRKHDLRFGNLFVFDAAKRTLPARLVVDGPYARVEVDTRDAVFPVTIDPTYTSMPGGWSGSSDQDGSGFGFDVAGAGDINGDGYDDIIVGAHQYNVGASLRAGRVFLFLGSADGISAEAAWSFSGGAANDNLGTALDGVGDINGDGFDDIVIGAPRFRGDERSEGRVYGFLGAGQGLNAEPDWTWEGGARNAYAGSAIAAAGDVNNDGFADFIVGVPGHSAGQASEGRAVVFYGNQAGFPATEGWSLESDVAGTELGFAVAGGRDMNGDGYDDIAIGAPAHNGGAGRVYLVLGSEAGLPAEASQIIESADQGGYALDFCDTNGDGMAELYIGRPGNGARMVQEFVGQADIAALEAGPAVSQQGVFTGRALTCAGDINGDGFEDLAVSTSRLNNEEGGGDYIYIHYGSTERLWSQHSQSIRPDGNNLFGASVDAAGDVDGDGLPDLVVGAPAHTFGLVSPGTAYIFRGIRSHLRLRPERIISPDEDNQHFGISVSGVGDCNADGFADVAIGATRATNGNYRGRVFLYLGTADGLSEAPHRIWDGPANGSYFGNSIGGNFDLNGDGFHDIVVGANNYDSGRGRVIVFFGARTEELPQGPSVSLGQPDNQNSARFGWDLAALGDVDGDGFDDLAIGAPYFDNSNTDRGRIYIYRGAADFRGQSFWRYDGPDNQRSAHFGYVISGAGDLNGDGLADLVVSAPYVDVGRGNTGRIYVYHGRLNTSPNYQGSLNHNRDNGQLGHRLAGGCDFNGDGFSDLITYSNGENRLRIYLGRPSGLRYGDFPDLTIVPGSTAIRGLTCGDVNSDGFDDFVASRSGQAWLWLGGETLSSSFAWRAVEPNNFGGGSEGTGPASIVGDLNSDGAADLVLGAYQYGGNNRGGAYVYYGVPGASASAADFTIASAGDLNGDGYDEVALGQGNYTENELYEGRILVFAGGEDEVSTTAMWSRNGGERLAQYGRVLASAGDVDDDGDDELLVGVPLADTGRPDAGRLEVFEGSPDGLPGDPSWTYSGNHVRARLGSAVSSLGDINDDGYADIVASAPFYSNGHSMEGQIMAFLGSEQGLGDEPVWTREENRAGARLGTSLSRPVDLDANTFNDLVVGAPGWSAQSGAAIVYMNTADNQYFAKLRTIVGEGVEKLGSEIAVGDFNGDFIDDFAVSGPYFDSNGEQTGRIAWAAGSFTGPPAQVTTVAVGAADERFGSSLDAGDFNGDGRADLVVGSPRHSSEDLVRRGRIDVFFGTAEGPAGQSGFTALGDGTRVEHGRRLGTGDYNGDSRDDIAVTQYSNRFVIYMGAADGDLPPQRVSLGAQSPPLAQSFTVVTNVNQPVTIPLRGVDVDGDPLTYAIVENPDSGQAVLNGAEVIYRPAVDFAGEDAFSYTANDGNEDSNIGVVTVRLNRAPSARELAVTTTTGTPVAIVLSGTDPEDDPLSFRVVDAPASGALAGEAPNLTFTPVDAFEGETSFTYVANDGYADSEPVTVTITVRPSNEAPTAEAVAGLVNQGGSVEIDLLGADEDGDALTYRLAAPPARGDAVIADDVLTYTAPEGFEGEVTFDYIANDGLADSAPATVTITVVFDRPPVVENIVAATNEDASVIVVLTGEDPEGAALTFEIAEQPANGVLMQDGSRVTYTPNPNFNGEDRFTYRGSDGATLSEPGAVRVTVLPMPDVPMADAQTLELDEDTSTALVLTGSDVDGDALSFVIVANPLNGTLEGAAPNLTYTPNPNFAGEDRFTFRATDGALESPETVVTLVVAGVNDQPTIADLALNVDEDTATAFNVDAADIDGDALRFAVADGPDHGRLDGDGPGFIYTPNENYTGRDTIVITVTDGNSEPVPATISIVVSDANDAPTVQDDVASVREDNTVRVTFEAADEEGDALILEIVEGPAHGELIGDGFTRTYAPRENFFGQDIIRWRASDGNNVSRVAVMTITVEAVNDVPSVENAVVELAEDTEQLIQLAAQDADEDPLTVTIVDAPQHGQLVGDGLARTYVPNPNFSGADDFTWRANDGTVDSEIASVSITVTPVNDAPVANPLAVETDEDTATVLELGGVDDGDAPLTVSIDELPDHGELVFENDEWLYTPDANFNGEDTFTYRVNDGELDSESVEVSITVIAVNDPPVAEAAEYEVGEGNILAVLVRGTDVDGDELTYRVVDAPAHGDLVGDLPAATYRPNADFAGDDSFTYVVNDGTVESEPALVTITVVAVDDAPIADDLQVIGIEDQAVDVTLQGRDPDGAEVTFELVSLPENGVLEGMGAERRYTPNGNFSGQDSFTYRVSDGRQRSAVATVTILVQAVNDAPTATSASYDVTAGVPHRFTLAGRDVDGDDLIFAVVTQPTQGQLAGAGAELIYTAAPGFSGIDFIEFTADDGVAVSDPVRVSFIVTAVNGAPQARDVITSTNEDVDAQILLAGSDPDGDPLNYQVITPPENGVLQGNAPNLTYTPNANYFGQDTFTYRVSDGRVDSEPARVTIQVRPVNDAPRARGGQFVMFSGQSLEIILDGSDVDGDVLSYRITGFPENGAIAGRAPTLTYTPGRGFVGEDTIRFVAEDAELASEEAEITVVIQADPNASDRDDDGLTDDQEINLGLDPNSEDSDEDGIPDADEVGDPENPTDTDGDGEIDALDTDSDNDGVPDAEERGDNRNPADSDEDGIPDHLDTDSDGDGVEDRDDLCPRLADESGEDLDGDGRGDECDDDRDGDGVLNDEDDCPEEAGMGADGCVSEMDPDMGADGTDGGMMVEVDLGAGDSPDEGLADDTDGGMTADSGTAGGADGGQPPSPSPDGGCQANSGESTWFALLFSMLVWARVRRRRSGEVAS